MMQLIKCVFKTKYSKNKSIKNIIDRLKIYEYILVITTKGYGGMLLKRGTGSGERGTGNGSLGTSCQRKPPQKSKMAVQKTRERKKTTKKGIRALVEIRWGRNCKSDSHFTFTF